VSPRAAAFRKASRITCVADPGAGPRVADALRSLGVQAVLVQSARSATLREQRFLAGFRGGTRLEEDLVHVYRVHVPPAAEQRVLRQLAQAADLAAPGRGSILSEPVDYCSADDLRLVPAGGAPSTPEPGGAAPVRRAIRGRLSLICCIVPRGEAVLLTKALLELGLSVPVVSYGIGMGMRAKLGLLRITIPTDKDMIEVLVDRHDAAEVFSYLTDAARLRYPGKGFMYVSPVRSGLVNTRIYRGEVRHVATMEQVIAAIDTLAKDTDWRRKSFAPGAEGRPRRLQSGMASYTITCAEGDLEGLVAAAMAVGAGGATKRSLRFSCPTSDNPAGEYSRESSDLVVPSSMVAQVHVAVLAAAGGRPGPGQIFEVSTVDSAVSYAYR
jgi:nitrogen regulatory protein PII